MVVAHPLKAARSHKDTCCEYLLKQPAQVALMVLTNWILLGIQKGLEAAREEWHVPWLFFYNTAVEELPTLTLSSLSSPPLPAPNVAWETRLLAPNPWTCNLEGFSLGPSTCTKKYE